MYWLSCGGHSTTGSVWGLGGESGGQYGGCWQTRGRQDEVALVIFILPDNCFDR